MTLTPAHLADLRATLKEAIIEMILESDEKGVPGMLQFNVETDEELQAAQDMVPGLREEVLERVKHAKFLKTQTPELN